MDSSKRHTQRDGGIFVRELSHRHQVERIAMIGVKLRECGRHLLESSHSIQVLHQIFHRSLDIPISRSGPTICTQLANLGSTVATDEICSDPIEPWSGIVSARVVPSSGSERRCEYFGAEIVGQVGSYAARKIAV